MYDIVYSPRAVEDLKRLKRNEPAAYVDVLSAYGHYEDK